MNEKKSLHQQALERHGQLQGKIKVEPKDPKSNFETLKLDYTPGVGGVSSHIAEHPEEARNYTWLANSVAVVSDGSSVLGLGNIGPKAALPVMEGKALIFRQFGGLDAVPIVLDAHEPDALVEAIAAIAPSFGGINLEDIAAPQCFEIEQKLKERLDIPVMHDDQHGTAIVVLAGLINAAKLTGRTLENSKIVISGAGAAGVAIAQLLYQYATPSIIAVDSQGVIDKSREDLSEAKQRLREFTDASSQDGNLEEAVKDADIFLGVSRPNVLSSEMIRTMKKNPIIFAMANPEPEIDPEEAREAGAAVIATGRSDFANQVNNALVFPGIFRGALDNGVNDITQEHKCRAAETLAAMVNMPSPERIIPRIDEDDLTQTIARVIH